MKSLAKKIALQFFLVITFIFLVLFGVLLFLSSAFMREHTDKELRNAIDAIYMSLRTGAPLDIVESELPYFITYTIFRADTKEILDTNDPFIPTLPVTNGKCWKYVEKNFYTDGDLDLLYKSKCINTSSGMVTVQVSIDMQSQSDIMPKVPIFLKVGMVILLPLLLVSYLASYLIAKHTLRPIVQMTSAAAKINSDNLDATLSVSESHNELDNLASTFNDLFLRIKQDFIAVQAANEAKSAFLSNMSHEIRTPINAVLGLDEMILRESSESNIKEYALDIQSSGKSLLSIINDILDFSKIEAGKMEIIPVNYDVCEVINNLQNMILPRAQKKGLDFFVNVDENIPCTLRGDEIRVKQCILNILTNAVKYTKDGSVTMNIGFERLTDSDIMLKVQVIDTGIGIKAQDIKKLFSPFERIEEKRNRTIEGTGLGMSIVKSLLNAMGSSLEVKSVYGEGSDFSFAIKQSVVNWEKIGNYAERRSATKDYEESFQAPEAKILVVDDTQMNLTVVKGLLKASRIQIDTALSARSALEMAKKTKYDILFIDHRMPEMDGVEMLHALRADSESVNEQSVCIALTANAISGSREMYLAEGFNDYLSKPIDTAKLEAMLRTFLPKDKIILRGEKGFVAQEKKRNGTGGESQIEELWQKIFAQDVAAAIKNCGSAECFYEATRNFYDGISEKSDAILRYAAEGDYQNYTVLVHALKSSARLIGIEKLSAMALHLEQCGDKAKSGGVDAESAIAEIKAKTDELVSLYRSYEARFAALFGERHANESEKSAIDTNRLQEGLAALKEVVSVYDFDSADCIMCELSSYEMPKDFKERFKEIKKALQCADQSALMSLLDF